MCYIMTIDVSKDIDVNKTSTSRECITCHYWHHPKCSNNSWSLLYFVENQEYG